VPKRFLRAIRLDESDKQVFEFTATPGEWVVTGSFAFLYDDPARLQGKRLQAFRGGFLGTDSLGWSTLAEIAEIDDLRYLRLVELLATQFIEHFGAPNMTAAEPAARQEIEYTASLCEHDLHTLLAIHREFTDDGIVERLRVVHQNAVDHKNVKLWGAAEE
jgi:hypothetical protein